jgi:putative colanic acid biosynthesis acetyltransferase WcaF
VKQSRTHQQADAYSSPWNLRTRLAGALWHGVWLLLFRPTPKFAFRWRAFLLRCFGARLRGTVFVDASARIRMPWNLRMDDRACIGPGVVVYNLGRVTLKRRCTIAQEVYLCAGTHDLSTPDLPLVTAPIVFGEDTFVGVRALVLPGVQVGDRAVVGAGSVVTKDLPAGMICTGNPCRPLHQRAFSG